MPFLENVTRGRGVPRERLQQVAEHYYHFGGKSPINAQNLALIEAVRAELEAQNLDLKVYYGNRNWHPLLPATLRQMQADGVERALAFFTSAFSSYSGCRQYRENLAEARAEVGPGAPELDKLRMFYNHPGFIEPLAEGLRTAWESLPPERQARSAVLFSAHSIPETMAQNCAYVAQLEESARLVALGAGVPRYELVYQSRSGSPHQPWLEPDVGDRVRRLAADGVADVLVSPVGFISDHMEVLFDLDTELAELCQELGVQLHRLPTVGTDPRFVAMIVELIKERCGLQAERRALGGDPPSHDVCPENCCLHGVASVRPAN